MTTAYEIRRGNLRSLAGARHRSLVGTGGRVAAVSGIAAHERRRPPAAVQDRAAGYTGCHRQRQARKRQRPARSNADGAGSAPAAARSQAARLAAAGSARSARPAASSRRVRPCSVMAKAPARAVAGGVVGDVVGNQVGKPNGRNAMTVLGAERRQRGRPGNREALEDRNGGLGARSNGRRHVRTRDADDAAGGAGHGVTVGEADADGLAARMTAAPEHDPAVRSRKGADRPRLPQADASSTRRYWIASAKCGSRDRVAPRQVGDGARHAQHAVKAAGRPAEPRRGALQELPLPAVERGMLHRARRRQRGVEQPCRASARCCARSATRSGDIGAASRRRVQPASCSRRHRRHLDLQIDADRAAAR